MGKPNILKKSVLAFVDILGYKDLIKINKDNLEKLEEILEQIRNEIMLSRYHIDNHSRDPGKRAVRAFSDCFVINYNIGKENSDIEFGETIEDLIKFQANLALQGIFLRGGISIDFNFVDENIIFGNGLICSYELESNVAIYPRIILSKEFFEAIKNSIESTEQISKLEEIYLVKWILKDSDDYWFLNYLSYVLLDSSGNCYCKHSYDMLSKHKHNIIKELNIHSKNKRVYPKYVWVAQYHNWFCRKHFADNNDLIIEIPKRTFSEWYDLLNL